MSEKMRNKDFTDILSQSALVGMEEDNEVTDGDGEVVVEYDEIDSSKTLQEEIADLMAQGAVNGSLGGDEEEVCVGTNLEQYIGYESLYTVKLEPKRVEISYNFFSYSAAFCGNKYVAEYMDETLIKKTTC